MATDPTTESTTGRAEAAFDDVAEQSPAEASAGGIALRTAVVKESIVETEFIIDEEPVAGEQDFDVAVVQAIRREHSLRESLADKNLGYREELYQIRQFLKNLIDAIDENAAEMIAACGANRNGG